MIEWIAVIAVFGSVYLGLGLFGYYSAVNHLDRLLDIDEPEGPPEFVGDAKRELGERKALTPDDIDRMDEWDDWNE